MPTPGAGPSEVQPPAGAEPPNEPAGARKEPPGDPPGGRTGSPDGADSGRPPSERRHRLWQKLALTFATFGLLILVLELAAGLFAHEQAPRRVRDGVYIDAIPLCTGLINFGLDAVRTAHTEQLPIDAEEGQTRIFVFGESSVAGSPFGPETSAPAILHDLLVEAAPERDFVVVNMGNPGSVAPNTYYHMLAARRFQPDIIVLYFGINDGLAFAGEECFAAKHQALHAIWRSLVERLEFLWVTRVYTPALVASGSPSSSGSWSCDTEPFPYWADLVVRLATKIGARVVVTTPIRSSAYALEVWSDTRSPAEPLSEQMDHYVELIECQLRDDCDYPTRFEKLLASRSDEAFLHRFAENERILDGLADAWREAADTHDAIFVDFRSALAAASPNGRLLADYFTDEIHLTVAGYGFLARNWFHALAPELGLPVPETLVPPTPAEVARYTRTASPDQDPMVGMRGYLRGGFVATSVPGLKELASTCWHTGCVGREEARTALEWLRWRAGLLPDLSPEAQAPLLEFQHSLDRR